MLPRGSLLSVLIVILVNSASEWNHDRGGRASALDTPADDATLSDDTRAFSNHGIIMVDAEDGKAADYSPHSSARLSSMGNSRRRELLWATQTDGGGGVNSAQLPGAPVAAKSSSSSPSSSSLSSSSHPMPVLHAPSASAPHKPPPPAAAGRRPAADTNPSASATKRQASIFNYRPSGGASSSASLRLPPPLKVNWNATRNTPAVKNRGPAAPAAG